MVKLIEKKKQERKTKDGENVSQGKETKGEREGKTIQTDTMRKKYGGKSHQGRERGRKREREKEREGERERGRGGWRQRDGRTPDASILSI